MRSPCATARESPCAATKTQHSQKQIKKKKKCQGYERLKNATDCQRPNAMWDPRLDTETDN